MSIHNRNKERIGALRAALYDIDAGALRGQLGEIFAADCLVQLANPLETLDGAVADFMKKLTRLCFRQYRIWSGAISS